MSISIKKRSFFEMFFPLVALGFIGQGTYLISFVLSANTRWLLLFVLLYYLFAKGKLFQGIPKNLLLVFWLYLFWCAFTVVWSDIYLLSSAKAGVLILISITMTAAGFEWSNQFHWKKGMHWLCFVIILVFISGLYGWSDQSQFYMMQTDSIELFKGMTNNPNLFGCYQAMILPLLLWKLYDNWTNGNGFKIWLILLGLSSLFLIHTCSRSAMLATACVLFFFILSLNVKKKMISILVLMSILIVVFTVSSMSIEHMIFKGDINEDLLKSRRNVWEVSYEKAITGGLIGAGYGVSIGEDSAFNMNGLSSSGYGREKSNSQLGIIEETGFVGLGLYLLYLLIFYKKTLGFYSRLRGPEKVYMGLLLGAITGILLQSVFEAWWDAPASPEAIFFWILTGTIHGFMKTNK